MYSLSLRRIQISPYWDNIIDAMPPYQKSWYIGKRGSSNALIGKTTEITLLICQKINLRCEVELQQDENPTAIKDLSMMVQFL